MDEAELLRRRQSLIEKLAHLTTIVSARIRFAQTAGGGHGVGGKVTEQLWAHAAAADLCTRAFAVRPSGASEENP